MRLARVLLFGAGAGLALFLVYWSVGNWELRRARQELERLEREKSQLIEYAQRLTESQRVAQVSIQSQTQDDSGAVTRLTWQEIGANGLVGRPLEAAVRGTQVYFEALVLKFEPRLVGAAGRERSTSVALFRRVFGDEQPPRDGPEIGRDARPPLQDSAAEERQARLWSKFWEFVDDPREAARYGVRVAQIEAPSIPVQPGQLLELRIDAAGGINISRLDKRY